MLGAGADSMNSLSPSNLKRRLPARSSKSAFLPESSGSPASPSGGARRQCRSDGSLLELATPGLWSVY
jgi:hypothetical protein